VIWSFALGIIVGIWIARSCDPLTPEERVERRVNYVVEQAMAGWRTNSERWKAMQG